MWIWVRTGFGVALKAQHDLGRAVPARRHVLSHVARILLRVHRKTAGQSKIADLELAVGVDQQIAGLQVAVQHIGRVDVLQAAQNLVDEGLEVGVGEGLARADDGGQIALHELWGVLALFVGGARGIVGGGRRRGEGCVRTLVEVALVEVVRAGDVHVVETCDLGQSVYKHYKECKTYVAVASKVLQQLDLAQGALGQDLLAEDIGDLLDGDALARPVVGRGAVWSISVLCCAVPCWAVLLLRCSAVQCSAVQCASCSHQTMP